MRVRLQRWHHSGVLQGSRDSVDCSCRAWQAQRNCFGAKAFLSSLANQLYEKMSHFQPGWHSARTGLGTWGLRGLFLGFFGFHFQQKCTPAPLFSPQELCLLSQHRWELEGAVSQRPLVGTGLSPDSQCGGQRWIQVFKQVTT